MRAVLNTPPELVQDETPQETPQRQVVRIVVALVAVFGAMGCAEPTARAPHVMRPTIRLEVDFGVSAPESDTRDRAIVAAPETIDPYRQKDIDQGIDVAAERGLGQ